MYDNNDDDPPAIPSMISHPKHIIPFEKEPIILITATNQQRNHFTKLIRSFHRQHQITINRMRMRIDVSKSPLMHLLNDIIINQKLTYIVHCSIDFNQDARIELK